ncbi:MAG: hypothetical protein RL026_176 [Pseudomonadota bacterium]|jgi:hypothetical protein
MQTRTGWLKAVLAASAMLAASGAANAAINILIERTSDKLATLHFTTGTVDGPSSSGTASYLGPASTGNPATTRGFFLYDVFRPYCVSCQIWPTAPLTADNIENNTVLAGTTTFDSIKVRYTNGGTNQVDLGYMYFHWDNVTNGTLTGSVTLDLSDGLFTNTPQGIPSDAVWQPLGTTGRILGLQDNGGSSADVGTYTFVAAGSVAGSAAPVPEPETWALMLFGSTGLLWRLRRTQALGKVTPRCP